MKTTKKKGARPSGNASIRALRETIGETQKQFAAKIGVSLDTVKSWETRDEKRISLPFAYKIRAATGVNVGSLIRGDGKIMDVHGCEPYEKKHFEHWKKNLPSDEASAESYLHVTIEAVSLLYRAAARRDNFGKDRLHPLHLEMNSLLQKVYKDFRLAPRVRELLEKQKKIFRVELTYGEWRAKGDSFKRFYGFKDDPKEPGGKKLVREVDAPPALFPLATSL